MAVLVSSKFYLPPVPVGFVARPQLFEKLDETLRHYLTLVSAPAGAGKTTLVSAWAQAARKRGAAFGWLSLDEGDNAPGRFWEYLAACLEESGAPLDFAALVDAGIPQAAGDTNMAGFIQGLAHLEQELILILDDYHLIHNPQIHTALGYFLNHLPPRLHLVILTRSDPPLELARLRVAGQLAEVRMEQLRFSAQEAAAFLKNTSGKLLSEADVVTLNTRAEGWIAGLQMAAISLRQRQDVAAFVAAFAGSHRFVFDYLLEQVLNQQPPEVREFLLLTSVLERFSAPLCDAVLETGHTARGLLDRLERANMFLMPLDDERRWYRYHHLFADLLKLVLEQKHPGLAAELHHRASRWYEAQEMAPEALQHALAAGDMGLAARLVSANVLALVEHAELMPILLHLDAAPRQPRQPSPWLDVAHAWALAYTGQMVQASEALRLAATQLEELPLGEQNRITGHIAAVRAYAAWVDGNQRRAVEFAETAEQLLPAAEVAVRALNLTTLGNALTQYTASSRAVEVLEQATTLARQAGQSHVFMLAATALAYAYIRLGKLHKAHSICLEAIENADAYQQRRCQPLPAAASAYAELAHIMGEWGEIEPAIQAARKGLALSEPWGQTDTILLCLLHLADGLALAHEFQAAQQVIQRAHRMARKVSPWFELNVEEVELFLWLEMDTAGQSTRAAPAIHGALPVSLEARLLLRQSRPAEALRIIEKAQAKGLEAPSGEALNLGIIRSLALFAQQDDRAALLSLKQALELAAPESRVTCFVREGEPMEQLLRLARKKSIVPKFTQQLLDAFAARRQPGATAAETLIEPLSERELEILRFLNSSLSTPEIAEELIVSANTIRTHIKNIYAKLGVHGRSAAVRQAQELGLMH